MTIEIPIGVNTRQAQAGLQQIQRDLQRLQRAAEAFNRIDLSAGTEDLRRDLEAVQRNFNDLTDPKRNRRFNERLKSLEMGDAGLADILENWDRLHPDLNDQERGKRKQRLIRNVLNGTPWEPPDPSADPASPGNGRPDRPHDSPPSPPKPASSPGDSLLNGLMGGAKFGLGLMGVQAGVGALGQGFEMAKDVADSTDQFMRRSRSTGDDFDYLRRQLRQTGDAFGIANDEAARLSLAFLRASASTGGANAVTRDTHDAIGFARGLGMDPMQTVQQFGRMQYFGIGGSGVTDGQRTISPSQRQLALQMAAVIAKGGLWGKSEEVVATFTQAVEKFGHASLNRLNTEGLAGYQMSMLELAAQTNRPGLAMNSGMMAALDRGVRQPGGGTLGQFTAWQALGPHMGTFNPLALEWMQAGGAFENIQRVNPNTGQLEDTGVTNAQAILSLIEKQAKGFEMAGAPPEWQDLAAGKAAMTMLGLENIRQGQAMVQANRIWASEGKGGLGNFQQAAQDYGVDLTKLEGDAIKPLSEILLNPGDLAGIKRQYADWQPRIGFKNDDPAKKQLDLLAAQAGRGDVEKDQAFITAFVKEISERGGQKTEATELNQSIADLKSTLEEQVGQNMVTAIKELTETIRDLIGVQKGELERQQQFSEAYQAHEAVAQAAHDEMTLAQADLDKTRPGTPERAAAVKKKQEIFERQQENVQQSQQKKVLAYRQQNGPFGFFVDKLADFYNPFSSGFLKGDVDPENPLMMPASPSEEKLETLAPLEKERRDLARRANELRNGMAWQWLTSTPEDYKKRHQELREIERALQGLPPAPVQRALGGPIPGYGGGDRVPALLEAGEFVINKAATTQHRPLLEQINSGALKPMRRALGGPIPGDSGSGWPALPGGATLPAPSAPLVIEGTAAAAAIQRLEQRLDHWFTPVIGYLSAIAQALKSRASSPNAPPAAELPPPPPIPVPAAVPNAPPLPLPSSAPSEAAPAAPAASPRIAPPSGFPGDGRGYLSPALQGLQGRQGGAPFNALPSGPTSEKGALPAGDRPASPDAPSAAAPAYLPPGLAGKDRAEIPKAFRAALPESSPPSAQAIQEGAALPQGQPLSGNPAEFVRAVRPAAEQAAQELGVSPTTLIAQAAHETAWGKRIPRDADTFSHNLFGIKASRGWTGDSVRNASAEHGAGGWSKPTSAFRAYASYEDSFKDYVRFLQNNPRYQPALEAAKAGDDAGFVRAMHQAGYATDPNYASKVLNVKRRVEAIPTDSATPAPATPATPAPSPIPQRDWTQGPSLELPPVSLPQTPMADAPTSDTPTIPTPTSDTPAIPTPTAETPAIPAPTTETPTAETPALYALGGSIPGYGGGDRIPARLEPGEFVLRKEAVRSIGVSALDAFNQTARQPLQQALGGMAWGLQSLLGRPPNFGPAPRPRAIPPLSMTHFNAADRYRAAPPGAPAWTWQSMDGLPPITPATPAQPAGAAPISAGFGLGQLEVLIRQQDHYGARLGQDVLHVMDLRVPSPYGRIHLDAINGR